MPRKIRGKSITPPVRRAWAEASRSGKSELQIANEYGVDVRTVRRHLLVGRDELLHEQARRQLFQSTLETHQRQLVDLARSLRLRLIPPPQLAEWTAPLFHEGDWESRRLLDSLIEHLPHSHLRKGLAEWTELSTERLRKVRQSSENRAIQTIGDRDSGLKYLLVLQADALIRKSQDVDTSGFPVRAVNDTTFGYGAYSWPFDATTNGQQTEQRIDHERARAAELLRQVSSWPEVIEGREVVGRLEQLRRTLGDELEVIVLRQVFPGECVLCSATHGVARSRRKRNREEGR